MVDPDDKLANVAEDKDIVRPDKNANKNFISNIHNIPAMQNASFALRTWK